LAETPFLANNIIREGTIPKKIKESAEGFNVASIINNSPE
jgi:hypothetical protein